jgi:LacI family transcriptional regulator
MDSRSDATGIPGSTGLPRAATINDVAKAAGVSRQTVTRAMNDMADVSATTRARVIAAARSLNYRPNRAAQGLVRGREVAIGLVVRDLRNPYYPELASELTRRAAARGWSVMLCDLGSEPADARRRLEIVARRVDAVVTHIAAPDWTDVLANVPTVVLEGTSGPSDSAVIEIDYASGIRDAIDHFVRTGRRRIAMIDTGERPSGRRIAYRAALAERDLPWSSASEVVTTDTHEGGVEAVGRLRAAYPDADAALVFNDVMAVGVLKGLARAAVAVPGDIAVIGIDGLDIGTLVTPELTSLALDKGRLADEAIRMVDALLTGSASVDTDLSGRLTHTLVVRESA